MVVRGAVKVKLHNPASAALTRGEILTLDTGAGPPRQLRFQLHGAVKGGVVITLQGVQTPEEAAALRGARIRVARAALAPLAEGEFYYVDLLGCAVQDEAGAPLGEVAEVFEAGAADVLVVRQGEAERLIPLVEAWICEVDLLRRLIRVRGAEQFEPQPR